MEELKEIRLNDNRIILNNNLVKSGILPRVIGELDRDVVIQGNCVVEGAIYARNLEVEKGPLEVQGAIFTQLELHVNNDAKGKIVFRKAVGSADSIVSHAPGSSLMFLGDVNAKKVTLTNAFIAGSVFADEAVLNDSIVLGGVFATRSASINNCITGTFNSPRVNVSKSLGLLLPSAFSVEKISALPGTEIYSLSLADLGSLYKGSPQTKNSGKISINIDTDELKSVLNNDGGKQVLRSYSVIGKVLAADLLDIEKLNNHFLITAASLGNQLLTVYNLGADEKGNLIELTTDRLVTFFFEILHRKIDVQELDGSFELKDIISAFN